MSIVYEALCDECGSSLNVAHVSLDSGDDLCIKISPCEPCLEERRNEGFEQGKEEEAANHE